MNVGVIGSGSIGPDLAYGFVSAGAKVTLVDIRQEALDAGVARIRGYADKGVARGKLSPKQAKAMAEALVPTRDLSALAGCDYVLEAASEDLAIKQAILGDVEKVVTDRCLVGFATSGIPRAQIAAQARRPERCFVNHPFFPAWRSLPVEVVLSGDAAAGQAMLATLRRLGKVPIVTADVACFAADDIFCNYICEAVWIAQDGIATPAQIDAVVDAAIGGGGPFNVMDATRGNLLTVHCQELMREAAGGNQWFEPPALLARQGNRPWHDPAAPGDRHCSHETAHEVLDRILAVLLGRTYFVVENDICAPTELDWMTKMALGFRTGLVSLAEDLGAERTRDLCRSYAEQRPGFPVPRRIEQRQLVDFARNVVVDRDGEVAVLRVFRPEVRNALSERTITEIDASLTALAADPAVRGVVFTSWDGALAGADIGELASLPTPEACREICLRTHPVQARMEAFPKPLVAAVDGPVLGGGAELSMSCHARVVGPRLVLGQPEVNLGIIPGYGGTQRLPRLIGIERANQLLRTGGTIGAAEACALGWATGQPVDDVVAAAIDLIKSGTRLVPVDPAPIDVGALPAVDIGHRSRRIDAILVDVIRRGLALPLAQGLAVEADGFARCKQTVDMDIGIKNFVQNGPRVPAMFLHE